MAYGCLERSCPPLPRPGGDNGCKSSAHALRANLQGFDSADTQTRWATEAAPSIPDRHRPSETCPPVPKPSAGSLPYPHTLPLVSGGVNWIPLFWHCSRRAASRALCTAGNSNAMRIPMIVMTTSNSTSVKPVCGLRIPRLERVVMKVTLWRTHTSWSPAPK